MAIPTLVITENYDALTILRESQLNTAMTSIEDFCNTNVTLNFTQFALDVFGTYEFNNDGLATLDDPLVDLVAYLSENETITGAWIFEGATTFSAAVSSSSTFTSSGQTRARAFLTSANQAIATATSTAISFNSETYDVGSMHDNSTNPNRLTVPTGGGGIYSLDAQVTFAKTLKQTLLLFTGDFVASNVINLSVNGVAIAPVTFSVSQSATLALLATAIAALADVDTAVTYGTQGLTLTSSAVGTDLVVTGIAVTLGASQTTGFVIEQSAGEREVAIYKSGSKIAESKVVRPEPSEECVLHVQLHDTANAGDYYDVRVIQTSGANLDVVLGERVSYFSAMKVW